jgi:hypothetical protein
MNEIIQNYQVIESVVKILYKNSQGTGFYITSNIIVSAYHTFFDIEIDEKEIKIFKGGLEISGVILITDPDLDLCLIEVSEICKAPLKLYSTNIEINESWETFGFPFQGEQNTVKFYGTISHEIQNEKYNLVLNSKEVDLNIDYSGLSGAPVVVNGNVIGLILKQLDDKLGAISINQIEDFLSSNGIPFEKEKEYRDLPNQFIEDIKTSVQNDSVLNKLEKSILKDGKWVLMTGNPGSGKSLNVATFSPGDNISILGKYFVKVPNDDTPRALRISMPYFLKWLEEIISFTLYGKPFPKEEMSIEDRIKRLPILFSDLNNFYSAKSLIGVLFIDGLDEIEKLNDFLGILNFALPEKIRIVLSCTSQEIVPSNIKNYFDVDQIIEVTPIETVKCEYFILKEIGRERLNIEYVQQIANKSEGHPLYLRYLSNIVKDEEALNNDNFSDWIETIPAIKGDIENYYNNIWDKIYQDETKLWISLIVSQLRNPLVTKDIIQILPTEFRLSFLSKFPSIKYLFKEHQDAIEIYHNSFKYFVSDKAKEFVKSSNDYIVSFCEKNKDKEYSLENILYHYTLSNTPEKALDFCNQEWADSLAVHHIEPDLILLDIKSVIELSIKLENTTELIRLLLLLQRIEFRYDYLLFEYAQNIALALIANGKYRQALKYIVRRNLLLVTNHDAITFLQLFYEAEAFEEANILLEAIDSRFRKAMEDGLGSNKGIPFENFVMKTNALTLSTYEDFDRFPRYVRFKMFLRKLYDDSLENASEQAVNSIYDLREYVAAWNQAYMLRSRDIFMYSKEVSNKMNVELDDKWAKMIALSKVIFDVELNQYNTSYFETNDGHLKIVKDIEHCIINHGYTKDKSEIFTLIKSLIKDSKNTTLVEGLIKEYLSFEETQINFRDSNGVDFNYQAFQNLSFQYLCKGYINDDNSFLEFEPNWNVNGWESSLNSLIKSIYNIEGKVYKKASLEDNSANDVIRKKLKSLISEIDFSFYVRGNWDRSYQLPEQIFPILYSKLVNLCYSIDLELLNEFIESIKKKSEEQLSLFSEGYRNVLYEVIKEIILISYQVEDIIPLVELWEKHILSGVQNRWERTEELLKIAEVYGLLNLPHKFDNTFGQMLNTSMGPSWYKESQLDLINSTLTYFKNDNISLNKYLRDYASLLDFASGEMTFQRYIRYEKEDFIASLILNNRLSSALKYFKQEVLPSPTLLIKNAEEDSIDAISTGHGYSLGARNIVEQSGVLKILRTLKGLSPFLKWALCQIFTINDDNFRYITFYSEHIAETLNEIEILDDTKIDRICEKITEIIIDDDLNTDDTKSLLNKLYNGLTVSNIKRLQQHLASENITWGSDTIEKEVEENIEQVTTIVNEEERLKSIESFVSYFEKEKLSLWYANWSTEHTETRKRLKNLFKDDKEAIQVLSKDILKFYDHPWTVSREVLWFLEGRLSDTQIKNVYKIVNDHFHYIVRPTENVSEKFLWIETENEDVDSEDQIIILLIWLLNHPSFSIRNKAFGVLVELAYLMPDKVVEELIKSSLSDLPNLSTETSSNILVTISDGAPDTIKKILAKNPELVPEISKVSHLTILSNYVHIANRLKGVGFDDLDIELNKVIPESLTMNGDVLLEEEFLLPIAYKIEELNEEEFLNKEFCELLFNSVKDYCQPLATEEVAKSDSYLRRSFYNETDYRGRYYDLLQYSLNKSIMCRVSKENMKVIYNILNNV